ncbi:hypothetical protein pneo_cds_794 [Pandoravirus neocaledonia]|uniref:Uncharacterized protein n=1 Tax=Pandoravirus neocaledonia TaxID=2107708 RepID=A0A2U7UD58_9VIRU|nr:hypothetical protein pneo_cds_794 [Pandoravirus neocaledonia]AVK76401.1 hypothetical protein pneo_cds_794 [Pandoravirus neocaledonia]
MQSIKAARDRISTPCLIKYLSKTTVPIAFFVVTLVATVVLTIVYFALDSIDEDSKGGQYMFAMVTLLPIGLCASTYECLKDTSPRLGKGFTGWLTKRKEQKNIADDGGNDAAADSDSDSASDSDADEAGVNLYEYSFCGIQCEFESGRRQISLV